MNDSQAALSEIRADATSSTALECGSHVTAFQRIPTIVWVLGFHILSWIPISVIGGWYLTKMKLRFSDFRGAGATPPASAG